MSSKGIRYPMAAGAPIRVLRRVFGIPAHRPSAFNACVGAELKNKTYSTPPAGTGGKNDPRIRSAFTSAVQRCSGRGVSKAKKAAAA